MRVLKQHLAGGTIRPLIVAEVQRVLKKFSGDAMIYDKAAIELGITSKTLRNWLAPVEKGGWPELQPNVDQVMSKLFGAHEPTKKKATSKKKASTSGGKKKKHLTLVK